MFLHRTLWMWTSGKFSISFTIQLDAARRYLVTGAISGKSGGDYGQVYISTVCEERPGQVLCGVRGGPLDAPDWKIANLGIVELLAAGSREV